MGTARWIQQGVGIARWGQRGGDSERETARWGQRSGDSEVGIARLGLRDSVIIRAVLFSKAIFNKEKRDL
ncbi:hypothetical protein [Bartonella choladocola]|uniref:Uncharacterized protein n=1 Tax=Bartonella choladocola TaxID=2750995 RepID=A0A1U9MJT5_9HYPH|nr:hypothetical protein [Bartonella choladocola]AQT48116.1 hypothetical protein BBC0122_020230 [Bartonella choladocola]